MRKVMQQKTVTDPTRRVFTPEFRQGAVRLVLEEHRSVREAAQNLGVSAAALDKWCARRAAGPRWVRAAAKMLKASRSSGSNVPCAKRKWNATS